MTEAYGQRLGEALRVENGPAIVTRALRTADIAVTEIRCDKRLPEMCGPLQQRVNLLCHGRARASFSLTLRAGAMLRLLDRIGPPGRCSGGWRRPRRSQLRGQLRHDPIAPAG